MDNVSSLEGASRGSIEYGKSPKLEDKAPAKDPGQGAAVDEVKPQPVLTRSITFEVTLAEYERLRTYAFPLALSQGYIDELSEQRYLIFALNSAAALLKATYQERKKRGF